MAVELLDRFTGPNHDIPLPAYAEVPDPLPRAMPVRIAVLAEETLTPLGNTAEETWEALKAGRSGIVEKRYPPFTDPRHPILDNLYKAMLAYDPNFQRLVDAIGDTPLVRNYMLGQIGLEDPEVAKEMLKKFPRPEQPPQLRSIAAGTVKGFNPKEAFKFRFNGDEEDRTYLPIPEIMNKMDPFAQYAAYTGVRAAMKVFTHNGIPLVIPRIGPDGEIDSDYPLTINPALIHPSYFGIYEGCGFGGGDISAVVWERMKIRGLIPTADHMMLELIERGASQLDKALEAKGGGEGNVGACASSGKAAVNLIHSIMVGDLEAGIWVSTEGVINRPIAAASFDAMSALDRGTDMNTVSLSLHKDRRGFVMAEGAVAFVLADPDWASRHGIPILYEIIGYGNTSDAWDDTKPNGEDGERALRFSRRKAELQGPIEGKLFDSGHYTATPEGDAKEFVHTLNVYRDLRKLSRLIHGATKRLTGHLLGAAGAWAQFAVGKAIQEGVAWGTPRAGDGELMDEAYGADIPAETRYDDYITDGESKTFGFGGHNVVLNSRRVR